MLEFRKPFSCGSERQSVKKIDPRESATRNSLLVEGCERIVVSGWENWMTYAVGWGRGGASTGE